MTTVAQRRAYQRMAHEYHQYTNARQKAYDALVDQLHPASFSSAKRMERSTLDLHCYVVKLLNHYEKQMGIVAPPQPMVREGLCCMCGRTREDFPPGTSWTTEVYCGHCNHGKK